MQLYNTISERTELGMMTLIYQYLVPFLSSAVLNCRVALLTICLSVSFFVNSLVTTLNSLSAKYDDGNAMKNFFAAAHKAEYNIGICF